MNVAFRVLFTAVLCITPTVLFLGLWRGLQRLQNDELVARVADHHGTTVEDLVPGTRSSGARSRRAHDPPTRWREVEVAENTGDATERKNTDVGDRGRR